MPVRIRVQNYRVLRNVDWQLPEGVSALVGPNGSGKTTLLSVLGLWLKRVPEGEFRRRSICDDIEFEAAGQTVTANLIPPLTERRIPVRFAPNGCLAALLHLCAVAGAESGSVVVYRRAGEWPSPVCDPKFDELFQGLVQQWTLTIALATHSPVLIDAFREDPSACLHYATGSRSFAQTID